MKTTVTILSILSNIFLDSKTLDSKEQQVLNYTFDRMIKKKPTLPGRR